MSWAYPSPSLSLRRAASFVFLFLCTVMLPSVTADKGGHQDTLTTTVYACLTGPGSTTSIPTAATPSPKPALPKNYGIVIFRAFEMLDVFGPLDALQILSRTHKLNLYLLSDTLDIVTTEPATASMNPYNSSFFPTLPPTHTFATAPKDIEVLIIPGGLGTRSPYLNSTIDYIRTTYPKLRYLISVCTGAGLAAKAGVLDGRRATTNKSSWAATVALGPKVKWVPKARWVVDGNIWSSSGISAGIDVTLAFIEKVYGKENATSVANLMEYERHTDPNWDPFAEIFGVTTVRG